MREVATLSRRDLWLHWLIYPGHSLPTAAAPVLVACGLAIHDQVFAAMPALAAFFASWLVHIAGLFADNYQLLVRHPDVKEHPELIDAINRSAMTLRGIALATLGCLVVAAFGTGPYLLDIAGPPVIAIGALGIAGSLAYSSGPYPFGKLGISDLHFFLMFGFLAPAAAYYVQLAAHHQTAAGWDLLLHGMPLHAFIVGLPLGAFSVMVLIIDDIRDRQFDTAKGWRTVPIRFGLRFSRIEYIAAVAFAYGMPLWLWLYAGWRGYVLLPELTLPFAALIAKKICSEDDHDALVSLSPLAAFLWLGYAVLLAVGVAL